VLSLSLSLSLSLRRLGVGYRRRPTPGAEAFVGLFSGDEHPSGIPTPSLPFLPCDCAKPSTQTLSYLAIWCLLTFHPCPRIGTVDRMQKLSGLRSLEGFRSLAGSASMAMKAANPRPSPDTGGTSYGSFANLKITAGSDFVFASTLVWQATLIYVSLLISLRIFVWLQRNWSRSRLQWRLI
jgi:hypothetical protein